MSKKEVLNIIDANADLFKSYNAYEPKLDKNGVDRRVLTGLMDMALSVMYHAHQPVYTRGQLVEEDHNFCFVFDPSDGSQYRKQFFAEYKENRPPREEEFKKQCAFALKVIKERVGLPLLVYPGYEADDTIGSLANLYKGDYKINIFSIDKDLSQLVQDNVTLIQKIKKKGEKKGKFIHFDKEDVYNNLGVYPERVADYLALMGDTVDNLPGLKNIGKVKAAKIIAEYMSIEHLLAYKDNIENEGLRNQIKESEKMLILVKMLATIKCDLPIEQSFLSCCEFSEEVRKSPKYSENFKKMEEYFNWPSHYRQFFTS